MLAVTAQLSVREVLQTILTSARRLLDARYAALGVPDDERLVRRVPRRRHPATSSGPAIGPVPRQHGLLGVMLRDPNPVRLADIRQHPQFGWWPAAHPVLTDFLGMPITDGDEILGELFLANKCDAGRLHRRRTRNCCGCSPRTRPSRWSTRGSTSAAANCPLWKNATGSPASCTIPCAEAVQPAPDRGVRGALLASDPAAGGHRTGERAAARR